MQQNDIRLSDYLNLLRRQRVVIIPIALAVVALAAAMALTAPDVYASRSSVRITPANTEGFLNDVEEEVPQNFSRELLTEMSIIESDDFREAVETRLGTDAPEFEDARTSLRNFSEIVDITVRASTPIDAATVADAYAEVFIEQRRDRAISPLTAQIDELQTRRADLEAQMDEIEAQLNDPATPAATAESLRTTRDSLLVLLLDHSQRVEALQIDVALREGATRLVGSAEIESEPVGTDLQRTTIVGLVLGILLGIGVGVVRDVLRDRISGRDDAEQVAGDVPVLAALPHMERDDRDGLEVEAPAAREGFRYLRTALRFHLLEDENTIIAVTSALSQEGKSTTAMNLARALAVDGTRVALIDCDLRRPSVHRVLGLPADIGLTSVLLGEVTASDAIHYPTDNLAVLPAGPPVSNPSELLGSKRFANLLRLVADQAELTILDVPPVLPVADPLAVGRHIGGVLVVARAGLVRRKELRTTLERLREVAIPIIGIVVNDTTAKELYGGYETIEPVPAGRGG